MKAKVDLKELFKTNLNKKDEIKIFGTFFKVDGSERFFDGFLNRKKDIKGTGRGRKDTFDQTKTVIYFDNDKEGYRSFKLENLKICTLDGVEYRCVTN